MRVLVTGASGFIGKNLVVRMREAGLEVLTYGRDDQQSALAGLVESADAIVHLAGENRPTDEGAFVRVNVGLTENLCAAVRRSGHGRPILFASSAQAVMDNPYGRSKLKAESVVSELGSVHPVAIYRLPGVFGKWCRPNYNSVVATFCFNVARDLAIQVTDPQRMLRLVHVDDVVDDFLSWIDHPGEGLQRRTVCPEYGITLGDLADRIRSFGESRTTLQSGSVGSGLGRALYATYVSYLPADRFSYAVPAYGDSRGVFVEMLKTPDSGQFSYFTAGPGVTRGGHYHHSKTEKFLVLTGTARFGFRNIQTGETVSFETSGAEPRIVETVPGWAHDITNTGSNDLVVMLWANEVFDRSRPDTVSSRV